MQPIKEEALLVRAHEASHGKDPPSRRNSISNEGCHHLAITMIMSRVKTLEDVTKGGVEIIRSMLSKVQASLLLSKGAKEGHFVVIATQGRDWEPRRFVVQLDCLNNPQFLRLLKQAEEEFGFSHEGALEIPCRPDELQCFDGIRRL